MARLRKSTKQKMMQGTLRPDRLNSDEPVLNHLKEIPKPPQGLNKYWHDAAIFLLNNNLLTESILPILIVYCNTLKDWERLKDATEPKDLRLRMQFENQIIKLANSLCITPDSHSKIIFQSKEHELDDLERIINM